MKRGRNEYYDDNSNMYITAVLDSLRNVEDILLHRLIQL